MKTAIALLVLFFSATSFANTYSVQDKSATIKYDQANHALVIGNSQTVTVTDENGKQTTHNRGVATWIPIDPKHNNSQFNR